LYLYNWFNDIGVAIEPRYIAGLTKHKIAFTNDFPAQHFEFLTQNAFLVDEAFLKGFYQREFDKQIQKEQNELHLILLPAGDACNFRCVYCYENHEDTARFKQLHSDKIFDLIERNRDKSIRIEYFGGEPLLNLKWILEFQERIAHIPHTASMTTNGYLLSQENMQALVQRNVKAFQITIDGLKEQHDKMRPKCGGSGSYNQIMGNIKAISTLKESFRVMLRCNFNQHSSSLEQRAQFFKNLDFIKGDYRFALLFRPIGLYSDGNNTTTPERKQACHSGAPDMQGTWEREAQEQGFLLGDLGMLTQIAGSVCYASKSSNLTINPKLEVLKCTIALNQDHNKFGNLQEGLKLEAHKLEAWEEYIQFDPACKNCFFFFQCMGRSCVLKNYLSKAKKCPIVPKNAPFLVAKIRKQKEILKKAMSDEKTAINPTRKENP
ncbi:radical SAM/SPASM domain-containing protein, partial [Helicobacter felis]|uniref:radical SAM/SPASM domain-containing protein n=1 Tax=Helicobacter felis TaxID=214 RepID=UPI0013157D21